MSENTAQGKPQQDEDKWKEHQLIKLWIQAFHRQPQLSSLQPDKKTVLQKKGSKTQTWYSRTFVLQGNFLFYYEEKLNDSAFKGVVLLKDCTVESMKFYENMSNVVVVQPRYPNRLLKFDAKVSMQTRQVSKKLYISCPTRAIMDEWKKAIELAGKFSQIVLPEAEQKQIVGVESDLITEDGVADESRPCRTVSMRSKIRDYSLAAVSFTLTGVSEQDDLAAKRLAKRVENFEALADVFGPIY